MRVRGAGATPNLGAYLRHLAGHMSGFLFK